MGFFSKIKENHQKNEHLKQVNEDIMRNIPNLIWSNDPDRSIERFQEISKEVYDKYLTMSPQEFYDYCIKIHVKHGRY